MDNKKWFREAKFGLMIHFGLYSLLAGEYHGNRIKGIGEWIQAKCRIPNEEYSKLAKVFNPIFLNAEEWVKMAKSAGMNYIVITSKHHEGFCLFKSDYDDFNCVDGSPYGRDIIGEFAEACRKYDMKLGIYYSEDLDWHEPNGGGYKTKPDYEAGDAIRYWTNNWDFPDDEHKDYEQYFRAKVVPQVTELLTKYGELCLVWFDTPQTLTLEQSKELYDLVKKYQPNCLVNSRIGNGLGDYKSMGDNQIPDDYAGDELVECPATLNDTWGFKYFDDNWKDPEKVRAIKKHLNDRGVNYLLNVGPDALGRIPAPALEILKRVGEADS